MLRVIAVLCLTFVFLILSLPLKVEPTTRMMIGYCYSNALFTFPRIALLLLLLLDYLFQCLDGAGDAPHRLAQLLDFGFFLLDYLCAALVFLLELVAPYDEIFETHCATCRNTP